MRRIVLATLLAGGIGFVGVPAGSAAPVNNTALKQAATINAPTIKVQHWRYGSRWGWGWRYRHHHCRYRSGWWC